MSGLCVCQMLRNARLILVPVPPNITNSGCSFFLTLFSIFILERVREMSWVGVWRVGNRESASVWRDTQIKAERGAGRERGGSHGQMKEGEIK